MRRAATIVLVVLQYKLYARQRPDTSWRLGIARRRAGWLTRLQNAAEMTSSAIGYVDGYTVYRYTVHGSSVLSKVETTRGTRQLEHGRTVVLSPRYE